MKQATRNLTVEVSATLTNGKVARLPYDLTVMVDDSDDFAKAFAVGIFTERFWDARDVRAEVTKRG